jgi:hypothetical protein
MENSFLGNLTAPQLVKKSTAFYKTCRITSVRDRMLISDVPSIPSNNKPFETEPVYYRPHTTKHTDSNPHMIEDDCNVLVLV